MPARKTPKKISKKTKSSPFKPLLYGLLTILGIAAVGYGIYSVNVYQSSEQEKDGFVVCNKDNTSCEVSKHIHADIAMNVCGQEIKFPKEKGNTNSEHTHKEQNKIHFHNRVKIDPVTKQPLDPSFTSVKTFLEQMEYDFPTTCENNATPTLTVSIGGKVQETGLDATWVDGDIIEVNYK